MRHPSADTSWLPAAVLLFAALAGPAFAQDEPSEIGEAATVEAPDGASTDDTPEDERYRLDYESYLEQPEEAARKGLADGVSPPWYAKEADAAIPIGIDPNRPEPYRDPVDPGHRESDWIDKPAPLTTGGGGAGPGSLLNGLPITGLVWTLIVLILVALAGLLVWALFRGERRPAGSADPFDPEAEEDPEEVQDRIERLPFEVRQGVVDFMEEARRLASLGKYEEALVYLYSFALVQLDRAHRIRLAKGKTNRQYVAEIESNPPLARNFAELVDEFERVFFGKYRLPQAKYEENVDRLQRFGALLQQASRG